MRALLNFILGIGCCLLEGYAIMYTWNTVLPRTFGTSPITIMQAIGLAILFAAFNATRDVTRSLNASDTFRRRDDDDRTTIRVALQCAVCLLVVLMAALWAALMN